MRKGFFIILIIALLTVMIPAAAQSEDIPSCTEEELAPTLEAVAALTASVTEVSTALVESENPTADGLFQYAALSSNFWYDQYPMLSTCLESQLVAQDFGLTLDEIVIENAMAQMAVYEDAVGMPDLAQAYLDFNASRAERNEALLASTFGIVSETGEVALTTDRLPSCTPEDDASEAVTNMMALIESYQETRNSANDGSHKDLANLVGGYAGISNIHWLEIYPELPACYEINKFAKNVGLIYEQTLISTLMSHLAYFEQNYGDAEKAAWLNSAAAIRQETLTALFTEAFPPSEG